MIDRVSLPASPTVSTGTLEKEAGERSTPSTLRCPLARRTSETEQIIARVGCADQAIATLLASSNA